MSAATHDGTHDVLIALERLLLANPIAGAKPKAKPWTSADRPVEHAPEAEPEADEG